MLTPSTENISPESSGPENMSVTGAGYVAGSDQPAAPAAGLPPENILSAGELIAPGVSPTGAAAARPGFSYRALVQEIVETIILTLIIYVVVNFATGRFRVEGTSMEPTVHPNEYLLVDKLSYHLLEPRRGDIIIFNYPRATDRDFIKRIIGLPGETVTLAGGVVSVNDQPLTEPYIMAPPVSAGTWVVGPDQYFVMGDNRNNSSDSRAWGMLDRKYLIGRAILVYWPPALWQLIPHASYAISQ